MYMYMCMVRSSASDISDVSDGGWVWPPFSPPCQTGLAGWPGSRGACST